MPEGVIAFFNRNDLEYAGEADYYIFTNFAPCAIKVAIPSKITSEGEVASDSVNLTSSIDWPSSEHLFQALKFTQSGKERPDLIEQVRTQAGPRGAQLFAKSEEANYEVKNWWYGGSFSKPGYCLNAMKWVLRKKVEQIPSFKRKLIETKNAVLVENSPYDKSWGNGGGGNGIEYPLVEKNGQNWLGKCLEELRTKLKNEETIDPLADEKKSAITLINQEMLNNPKIETSELEIDNQSWEIIIQKATKKGQIDNALERVLADVKIKRKKKDAVQSFQLLISQARQAKKVGDNSTLNELLKQIYPYQEKNSELYSQHESEIKQWEIYLGPSVLRDSVISFLNSLLQQTPRVSIIELRETNRSFQQILTQVSDLSEINCLKEQVVDNIAEVRIKKKFNQFLDRVKNAQTEEEKNSVIQEVFVWKSSTANKWEKDMWKERGKEAENFISKWNSGKDNSEDKKPDGLKQTLQIVSIGIFLVLVIWLLLKLVKRKKLY